MKKLLLGLFVLISASANAQILNPVKLSYVAKKTAANQYEIRIKAIMEPKWHLYSTSNKGGAGPTIVKFKNADAANKLKEEGKLKTIFERAFNVDQKFFEDKVDFVQVVKVKPGEKKVKGSIEYITCNDSKCLPPKEVEFEIKL